MGEGCQRCSKRGVGAPNSFRDRSGLTLSGGGGDLDLPHRHHKYAVSPLGLPPSTARYLPPDSLRVAAEIRMKGGVLGFYSGLSPAPLRHVFYTPPRIVGYEHLRALASDSSLLGKALAGGVSRVIAQILASPADLIKVRMEANGHLLNRAAEPRYAGVFDALRKIIKKKAF